MKKSTFFFSTLAIFSTSVFSQSALAQNRFVPLAVTGYNADVIAEGNHTGGGNGVIASTNNTVDRGNSIRQWCFADSTFINSTGLRPGTFLPRVINSITTPGLTYRLALPTINNSLRIDGASSGTLTLVSPIACSHIKLLATEGNGNNIGDKTVTLSFTDGSTQVDANIVVPDWYAGNITPAYHVGSRVNRGSSPFDGIESNGVGQDPTLYEVDIPISVANSGKLVQSIQISKTQAPGESTFDFTDPTLDIMGVSAVLSCIIPTITQNPAGTLHSSAPNSNQWYLNGSAVPGATGQTYVVPGAAQNGSYTVMTTSVAGCVSAAQVVMLTGTMENSPIAAIGIYPNPAPGCFTLRLPSSHFATSVTLFNALGQAVRTLPALSNETLVDGRGLPAGVYTLRLLLDGQPVVRRMVLE